MMDLLGWGEWIVIAILALIIVGPQDLPRLFYTLGQWVGCLREATSGLREEFEGLMRLEHMKAYKKNEEKERNTLSSKIDLLPFPSIHEKPPKPSTRSTRRRKSA